MAAKEQLAAAEAAAAGSALPFREDGSVDYSKDFFGERTNLTVSGQLNGALLHTGPRTELTLYISIHALNTSNDAMLFSAGCWLSGHPAPCTLHPAGPLTACLAASAGEMYATALGNIYTFGPTFRAENSNTARHLAEFWMIEPEMAFADLADDMACAEAYLKHCVRYILEHCSEDLAFFDSMIEKGLISR